MNFHLAIILLVAAYWLALLATWIWTGVETKRLTAATRALSEAIKELTDDDTTSHP